MPSNANKVTIPELSEEAESLWMKEGVNSLAYRERVEQLRDALRKLAEAEAESHRLSLVVEQTRESLQRYEADAKSQWTRAKRAEAENARIAGAGARLATDYKYLDWQSAGGPKQCAHGIAAGIPCRACDVLLLVRYGRAESALIPGAQAPTPNFGVGAQP